MYHSCHNSVRCQCATNLEDAIIVFISNHNSFHAGSGKNSGRQWLAYIRRIYWRYSLLLRLRCVWIEVNLPAFDLFKSLRYDVVLLYIELSIASTGAKIRNMLKHCWIIKIIQILSIFGWPEFERDAETLASADEELYCTGVVIMVARLQLLYVTVSCLAHRCPSSIEL